MEKHFVIAISAGRHEFEYQCSTMYEAYEAMDDAAVTFGIQLDRDELMLILVEMKMGHKLSHTTHRWRIRIEDGEV